mgnify:CR=1 FL=1
MGRWSFGIIVAIITLLFSILVTLLMWMQGIPGIFLVFFLPLIGFPLFVWKSEKEEKYPLEAFVAPKFCPRCGYSLEGWEKFCPVCGYKLKE